MASTQELSAAARKLNPRQRLFVENYAANLCSDKAQAYLDAGFKAKNRESARVAAHTLLGKADAEAYLGELLAERSERIKLTGDMVLEETRRLAFSNLINYLNLAGPDGIELKDILTLPEELTAAVQEISEETARNGNVTVRIKLHDKVGPLKALQKYFGVDLNVNELLARVRSYGYGVVDEVAPLERPQSVGARSVEPDLDDDDDNDDDFIIE